METVDIIAKLKPIFNAVFQVEVELSEKLTAMELEGWDSLNHIHLLACIEEAFSIKFTVREIKSLTNVGQLINAIQSKQ